MVLSPEASSGPSPVSGDPPDHQLTGLLLRLQGRGKQTDRWNRKVLPVPRFPETRVLFTGLRSSLLKCSVPTGTRHSHSSQSYPWREERPRYPFLRPGLSQSLNGFQCALSLRRGTGRGPECCVRSRESWVHRISRRAPEGTYLKNGRSPRVAGTVGSPGGDRSGGRGTRKRERPRRRPSVRNGLYGRTRPSPPCPSRAATNDATGALGRADAGRGAARVRAVEAATAADGGSGHPLGTGTASSAVPGTT